MTHECWQRRHWPGSAGSGTCSSRQRARQLERGAIDESMWRLIKLSNEIMVRPKHITKESNRMANAQRIVVHMSYRQMKQEEQRQQRLQEQQQRQSAHQCQLLNQQREHDQRQLIKQHEALQQHREQEQRKEMFSFGCGIIALLLVAYMILDTVWQSNKEWLNKLWK
jgi:hypothetical protein